MMRVTCLTLLLNFGVAWAAEPLADVRMVAPEGEGAKYWPRWRGPSGQGLVESGDYPDRWSPTENVIWRVETPGRGNSSPVIWADRLFLTSAFDGGRRRAILCFARGDGRLLWQADAPTTSNSNGSQGKNGNASETPCTDGERVYTYFGSQGVLAVDFEGKQVWHHDFGVINTLHGPAGSPLLYKDRVIVYQEQRPPAGGFIAALDKKTGTVLWKKPRTEQVGWGSPVAITVNGQDLIIVSSENKVYAYDPANGDVIWTCQGTLAETVPTPVVGHGLLFCCAGRSGPTLAIRPNGSGDISKTHITWKINTASPFIPSPILYGDYLYTLNDVASVARCIDARTGKVLWQERLGAVVKEGFSASPVAVDGKIFFTNDQGETFVLAAGPKFELLHVNRLPEKTLASPALLDGRWYIRTAQYLYCIGKK
jgi:outer membrane protein assembly factor BamB